MLVNVSALSKKAVDAALKKDWAKAIELNKEILAKDPTDTETKIRLGRAYLKTEKFTEAKKIYKEVLAKDPINQIALKNLKLAAEKNPDRVNGKELGKPTKSLLKEPGTTTEITFELKRLKLEAGAILDLKILKSSVVFMSDKREVGTYKSDVCQKLYESKKSGKAVYASVLRVADNNFTVLLKCADPIFKSEKQIERPYLQKGVLEETEIEIPELEEAEEI